MIKKASLIDVKEGYCLSVSERGDGCLHQIKIKTKSGVGHSSNSRVTVTMEKIYEFNLSKKVSTLTSVNFLSQKLAPN